jgi:hypothetical protein
MYFDCPELLKDIMTIFGQSKHELREVRQTLYTSYVKSEVVFMTVREETPWRKLWLDHRQRKRKRKRKPKPILSMVTERVLRYLCRTAGGFVRPYEPRNHNNWVCRSQIETIEEARADGRYRLVREYVPYDRELTMLSEVYIDEEAAKMNMYHHTDLPILGKYH